MRLRSKVALVTGAARGIGKAIASSFSRQGARVVLADIDSEENERVAAKLRDEGYEAVSFSADVSSKKQVEELVQFTISHYASIDVLVNNAAIWEKDAKILDVSEEVWDRTVEVCLKSIFLCTQQVLPAMIQAGGGSIINISSVNALRGVHLTAYTSAKGGILSLTRLLAVQYGPKNIRCNAICPGTIVTETTQEAFRKNPSLKRQLERLPPLNRLGKPEDIAECAVFLASDESQFATGAIFTIDGGLTAGFQLDV